MTTKFHLKTPLGDMIAIADEKELYLLEFADAAGLDFRIEKLRQKIGKIPINGSNPIIKSIEVELMSYFAGGLREFKTPIHLIGTPFQKQAWSALQAIPYGQTKSYKEQATTMERKKAFRAVANANAANPIAIVIPCHRIVCGNGNTGGYAWGIERKAWLLEQEKKWIERFS